MDLLNTLILGIVEGITEFLPISSTGHLILTARLLKIAQTDFLKSFEIAIQLGAVLSVVVIYWRSLIVDIKALKRVLAAFIPTAIIGFLLYKVIKNFLLGNERVVLISLFLGGIFLILFELIYREKETAAPSMPNNRHPDTFGIADISYGQAVAIGLFQSVSVIPGVSRAAATICGGLLLGLKRKTIVEFSFLLAVPTMLAATGFDLMKSAASFSPEQFGFLAVGFIVSFITAIIGIKFLLNFIKGHNFMGFGIYRVAAALLFWRWL